ncbi:MAG: hypothetical protein ACLR4Z_16175 [Butyricicoccaceae bacterium]
MRCIDGENELILTCETQAEGCASCGARRATRSCCCPTRSTARPLPRSADMS